MWCDCLMFSSTFGHQCPRFRPASRALRRHLLSLCVRPTICTCQLQTRASLVSTCRCTPRRMYSSANLWPPSAPRRSASFEFEFVKFKIENVCNNFISSWTHHVQVHLTFIINLSHKTGHFCIIFWAKNNCTTEFSKLSKYSYTTLKTSKYSVTILAFSKPLLFTSYNCNVRVKYSIAFHLESTCLSHPCPIASVSTRLFTSPWPLQYIINKSISSLNALWK